MSFVTATTNLKFRDAEYHPAYVHVGESGYELPIPATVYARLGDVTMTLHIDDARALIGAVSSALAEHGAATAPRVDLLKAVA